MWSFNGSKVRDKSKQSTDMAGPGRDVVSLIKEALKKGAMARVQVERLPPDTPTTVIITRPGPGSNNIYDVSKYSHALLKLRLDGWSVRSCLKCGWTVPERFKETLVKHYLDEHNKSSPKKMSVPLKSADTVTSSEPVKSTEPFKSTKLFKSSDSDKSTGPVESADQEESTVSAKSAVSVKSTVPIKSADKEKSTVPMKKTDSYKSTVPINTAFLVKSTLPIKSADPPNKSTIPIKSPVPIESADTGKSTIPIKSANPDKSTIPIKSNVLVKPTVQIKSAYPDKSTVPVTSADPNKSTFPIKSAYVDISTNQVELKIALKKANVVKMIATSPKVTIKKYDEVKSDHLVIKSIAQTKIDPPPISIKTAQNIGKDETGEVGPSCGPDQSPGLTGAVDAVKGTADSEEKFLPGFILTRSREDGGSFYECTRCSTVFHLMMSVKGHLRKKHSGCTSSFQEGLPESRYPQGMRSKRDNPKPEAATSGRSTLMTPNTAEASTAKHTVNQQISEEKVGSLTPGSKISPLSNFHDVKLSGYVRTERDQEGRPVWRCTLCSKSFKFQLTVQVHIMDKHRVRESKHSKISYQENHINVKDQKPCSEGFGKTDMDEIPRHSHVKRTTKLGCASLAEIAAGEWRRPPAVQRRRMPKIKWLVADKKVPQPPPVEDGQSGDSKDSDSGISSPLEGQDASDMDSLINELLNSPKEKPELSTGDFPGWGKVKEPSVRNLTSVFDKCTSDHLSILHNPLPGNHLGTQHNQLSGNNLGTPHNQLPGNNLGTQHNQYLGTQQNQYLGTQQNQVPTDYSPCLPVLDLSHPMELQQFLKGGASARQPGEQLTWQSSKSTPGTEAWRLTCLNDKGETLKPITEETRGPAHKTSGKSRREDYLVNEKIKRWRKNRKKFPRKNSKKISTPCDPVKIKEKLLKLKAKYEKPVNEAAVCGLNKEICTGGGATAEFENTAPEPVAADESTPNSVTLSVATCMPIPNSATDLFTANCSTKSTNMPSPKSATVSVPTDMPTSDMAIVSIAPDRSSPDSATTSVAADISSSTSPTLVATDMFSSNSISTSDSAADESTPDSEDLDLSSSFIENLCAGLYSFDVPVVNNSDCVLGIASVPLLTENTSVGQLDIPTIHHQSENQFMLPSPLGKVDQCLNEPAKVNGPQQVQDHNFNKVAIDTFPQFKYDQCKNSQLNDKQMEVEYNPMALENDKFRTLEEFEFNEDSHLPVEDLDGEEMGGATSDDEADFSGFGFVIDNVHSLSSGLTYYGESSMVDPSESKLLQEELDRIRFPLGLTVTPVKTSNGSSPVPSMDETKSKTVCDDDLNKTDQSREVVLLKTPETAGRREVVTLSSLKKALRGDVSTPTTPIKTEEEDVVILSSPKKSQEKNDNAPVKVVQEVSLTLSPSQKKCSVYDFVSNTPKKTVGIAKKMSLKKKDCSIYKIYKSGGVMKTLKKNNSYVSKWRRGEESLDVGVISPKKYIGDIVELVSSKKSVPRKTPEQSHSNTVANAAPNLLAQNSQKIQQKETNYFPMEKDDPIIENVYDELNKKDAVNATNLKKDPSVKHSSEETRKQEDILACNSIYPYIPADELDGIPNCHRDSVHQELPEKDEYLVDEESVLEAAGGMEHLIEKADDIETEKKSELYSGEINTSVLEHDQSSDDTLILQLEDSFDSEPDQPRISSRNNQTEISEDGISLCQIPEKYINAEFQDEFFQESSVNLSPKLSSVEASTIISSPTLFPILKSSPKLSAVVEASLGPFTAVASSPKSFAAITSSSKSRTAVTSSPEPFADVTFPREPWTAENYHEVKKMSGNELALICLTSLFHENKEPEENPVLCRPKVRLQNSDTRANIIELPNYLRNMKKTSSTALKRESSAEPGFSTNSPYKRRKYTLSELEDKIMKAMERQEVMSTRSQATSKECWVTRYLLMDFTANNKCMEKDSLHSDRSCKCPQRLRTLEQEFFSFGQINPSGKKLIWHQLLEALAYRWCLLCAEAIGSQPAASGQSGPLSLAEQSASPSKEDLQLMTSSDARSYFHHLRNNCDPLVRAAFDVECPLCGIPNLTPFQPNPTSLIGHVLSTHSQISLQLAMFPRLVEARTSAAATGGNYLEARSSAAPGENCLEARTSVAPGGNYLEVRTSTAAGGNYLEARTTPVQQTIFQHDIFSLVRQRYPDCKLGHGETVADLLGETVADQQGETAEQQAKTMADQLEKTVADQQEEIVADQQGEFVADQQREFVAYQQGQFVADQQREFVAYQQGETVADQQGETVADHQGETKVLAFNPTKKVFKRPVNFSITPTIKRSSSHETVVPKVNLPTSEAAVSANYLTFSAYPRNASVKRSARDAAASANILTFSYIPDTPLKIVSPMMQLSPPMVQPSPPVIQLSPLSPLTPNL